jgi:hypothetical protein
MNTSVTANQITQSEQSNQDPKLLLEREKFEFEKLRVNRDASSLTKRLAIGIGLAGTIITLITGATQLILGNLRAAEDRQLAFGKVLLEHGPKIYSEKPREREFAIAVFNIVSKDDKSMNTLFAKFAQGTNDEVIKNELRRAQVRVIENSENHQETNAINVNTATPEVEKLNSNLPTDISFSVTADEKPSGGYIFLIAVRASDVSKAKIDSVEYKIIHPSFKKKDYIGNSNSNFSMKYEGWGAVDEIQAIVKLKNGDFLKANIDMIKELKW